MEIRVNHHTTRAKARSKVESLLADASAKHGHMIKELEQRWEGDKLSFGFKAAGMKVSGSMEITDRELVIHAHVPIFAKPFEPKIAHVIENEAKTHFPANPRA